MTEHVIDTNVIVVADRRVGEGSGECTWRCIRYLRSVRAGRVLVDESWLILREYQQNMVPRGQPGPGSEFLRWLYRNSRNRRRCRMVPVRPDDERGFVEFPDDAELCGFDRADRKFVAVALASGTEPAIANASDRDWWTFREALERHGVVLTFVCPDLME